MRHKVLFALTLMLFSASSLFAQNQYNFSQFIHETGTFATQPGRWRGNDWLKLGLITAGSVMIMQIDEPVRNAVIRGGQKYYHSVPIEAGRVWGEWYTPPIIAGAFGLHGWLAHSTSSKKVTFELVQAVTYAEAITQSLKLAFGRARPFENQGAFSYHPFQLSLVGFHSLPGGHNTEGWAVSTVLSRNAHSRALKILAYVPAVFTFVSRIYQDQHWTSDNFLGAAIGVVVGSWVVNLHEKKESAMTISAVAPFTVTIKF